MERLEMTAMTEKEQKERAGDIVAYEGCNFEEALIVATRLLEEYPQADLVEGDSQEDGSHVFYLHR